MKNISKTVTRPIDDYLKFVQDNFNLDSFNYSDVVKQLDMISEQYFGPIMERRSLIEAARAKELKNRLEKITLLRDPSKYKKFDRLGNFSLDKSGLREVYKVADEIIDDIQVARDWLSSYARFSMSIKSVKSLEGLHEELLILGKSILGRAVEMTPKDTGLLRSSGVLLDYGTYIVIAFIAPYASYVHENLEISHPRHPRNPNCGGRAKFLEIALQEFFPDRRVWTEIHGFSGVSAKISINPMYIEYSHYS